MNDAATFIRDCISSGAVFTSLCALLTVPFLVLMAARLQAPRIARMTGDPLWQAPLAAVTAALPGIAFLAIAAYGLIAGWGSACLQFTTGRVLYAAIALITLLAVGRALAAVRCEIMQVRGLVRGARPASPRLSALAHAAGVPARELEMDTPFFALAGLVQPVVLVSRATLSLLSDAQIAAALEHEAAHRRRRDALLSLALLFLGRLFPIAVGSASEVYHAAREAAADRIALRSVSRVDLAGAIAVMARARYAAAPALSGNGEMDARVRLLVHQNAYEADGLVRTTALGALLATAMIGFSPLWLPALHLFSCSGVMAQ